MDDAGTMKNGETENLLKRPDSDNSNGNNNGHGRASNPKLGRFWSRFSKPGLDVQLSSDKNVLGVSVEDGKVSMGICRMNDKDGLYPLSFHKVSYAGLRDFLPSMANIRKAMHTAYCQVRSECRVPVKKVLFGLPSWNILSRDYSYEMAIAPPFSRITQQTIDSLEQMIRRVYIPDNYVILDTVYKSFIIDNNKQVRDPLGMVGEKIRLNAHLIIAELGVLEGLLDCMKELNLHVDVMVSPFIAGSAGVLTREESEAGVVLIDIGELFTSCSFIYGGMLFDTEIVKLGGYYVSSNVARNIQTTNRDIERVVENRKTAFLEGQQKDGNLPVPHLGRSGIQQVPLKRLDAIISISSEQLLDAIFETLKISTGRLDFASAGLVFIGENYLSLRGVLDLAERRINLPMRLGYPLGIKGLEHRDLDQLLDPSYGKLVGLIRHGYAVRHQPHYYLSKYYEPLTTTLWKAYRGHIRARLHDFVDRHF